MEFDDVLKGVPNYEHFLTVAESNEGSRRLASEHPKTTKLIELGRTGQGREMLALKIGQGHHNALIYGFPNPEEQLGGLALDYFSNALASDESRLERLDYTWYIINCIDPNGAELTKRYTNGPYTPQNFAQNYYRTPISATGWLCFPYKYGNLLDTNYPTQETKALMKIMEGRSFSFISSLHTMRCGGITYQVSEPCPALYGILQQLARENGVPFRNKVGTMLAPSVQLGEHLTPVKNYVEARLRGDSPLPKMLGARDLEYARLMNPWVFDMVPECCMWFDKKCFDESISDATIGEVIRSSAHINNKTNEFLSKVHQEIESALTENSLFRQMVEDVEASTQQRSSRIFDPPVPLSERDLTTKATIAQKAETEASAYIHSLSSFGGFLRMIDHQTDAKGENKELNLARETVIQKMNELCDIFKSEYNCQHYPLQKLVRITLGSILYSAEFARRDADQYSFFS
jgi:hypothetical protein